MSNPSRPADTRCFVADDYVSCRIDSSGVCLWCDLATCDACGAPVLAADAHRVHWVPSDCAPGLLCVDCLENGEGDDVGFLLEHMGLDADGVPVAVDEAETVRLPREPIGAAGLGEVLAERGREWAGRKAVAL